MGGFLSDRLRRETLLSSKLAIFSGMSSFSYQYYQVFLDILKIKSSRAYNCMRIYLVKTMYFSNGYEKNATCMDQGMLNEVLYFLSRVLFFVF